VQEFRKCIECFLCQDVCNVLRDHDLHDEFIGERFPLYKAALEMNPLDTEIRLGDLKDKHGTGYCNITKVFYQGVPGRSTLPNYRQRDHPAKGARNGRVLRSAASPVPGFS
jgi:succinate dehydrogenase / fumarate reductase iron-sulfur subunit